MAPSEGPRQRGWKGRERKRGTGREGTKGMNRREGRQGSTTLVYWQSGSLHMILATFCIGGKDRRHGGEQVCNACSPNISRHAWGRAGRHRRESHSSCQLSCLMKPRCVLHCLTHPQGGAAPACETACMLERMRSQWPLLNAFGTASLPGKATCLINGSLPC